MSHSLFGNRLSQIHPEEACKAQVSKSRFCWTLERLGSFQRRAWQRSIVFWGRMEGLLEESP